LFAKFKYFGKTVTDQNYIPEDIKSRLNSGNACYHSLQNFVSSCLKNIKIKIYITTTLPASYGKNVHWGYLRTGC